VPPPGLAAATLTAAISVSASTVPGAVRGWAAGAIRAPARSWPALGITRLAALRVSRLAITTRRAVSALAVTRRTLPTLAMALGIVALAVTRHTLAIARRTLAVAGHRLAAVAVTRHWLAALAIARRTLAARGVTRCGLAALAVARRTVAAWDRSMPGRVIAGRCRAGWGVRAGTRLARDVTG